MFKPHHKIHLPLDSEDPRDKVKLEHKELPEAASLKEFSGAAYDQGDTSSCSGFAICKAREYLLRRKLGNRANRLFMFAPLFTYALSRAEEAKGNEDNGVMLRTAFKVSHKVGMLPQEYYTSSDWKLMPTSDERDLSFAGKIKGYERILSLEALKTAIAVEHLPVVAGVGIFSSITRWGVFQSSASAKWLGNHALVIDSYDDKAQMLEGINSWGTQWGTNGRFKMPYAYYQKFVVDAWSFTKSYY